MQRLLLVLACIWTAMVSGLLLYLPIYASSTGAEGSTPTVRTTVLEVNGSWTLILLALPVLFTLAPLATSKGRRPAMAGAAAVALGLFSLAGAMSIGVFYTPAVLPLVIVALARRSASDPP